VPATDRNRQLLTLGACCFGLFMVMLDNTVVNVALPSIQQELKAAVSGLALVLDAYILVFASLLLTAGSLGDRYGRRRVFRTGLVVFTASSALCGLAPSPPALVAGRALGQPAGSSQSMPWSRSQRRHSSSSAPVAGPGSPAAGTSIPPRPTGPLRPTWTACSSPSARTRRW
jgi:MFS family permease